MSTALAKVEQHPPVTALAIRDDQTAFTSRQVAALHQLGVENASEGDLAVFFHQCKRTGMDPFVRQIHMVGRKAKAEVWRGGQKVEEWVTKYTIQTGIDGYRLIADRTGVYAGSDEAWGPEDANGYPRTATVTVHKFVQGQLRPFTATAHWAEYCQTDRNGRPTKMWQQMPHRMLAKCAEALALRKTFPQDLSGIYTAEEMAQADIEVRPANDERPPAPPVEWVPVKAVKGKAAKDLGWVKGMDADAEKLLLTRVNDAFDAAVSAGRLTVTDEAVTLPEAEAFVAEVLAAAASQTAAEPVDGEIVDGGEEPITTAQQRKIHALLREAAVSDDRYRQLLAEVAGVNSSSELSKSLAGKVIEALEAVRDDPFTVEGGADHAAA